MNNESTDDNVNVVTKSIGPNQFEITATATFNCDPSKIWDLLNDWEQLLKVGVPGMTENFKWLKGGPNEVPSTFQFELDGIKVLEEIYERTMKDQHRLRYRTLAPSFGILEYDAIFILAPIDDKQTNFTAIREVIFEPGIEPLMLADMIQFETKNLQKYFRS